MDKPFEVIIEYRGQKGRQVVAFPTMHEMWDYVDVMDRLMKNEGSISFIIPRGAIGRKEQT